MVTFDEHYKGIDFEKEKVHAAELQRQIVNGEIDWVRDTQSVLSAIRQWSTENPDKPILIENAIGTEVDADYMQNSSSACMAIATARAISSRLYYLKKIGGKQWVADDWNVMPAWNYFTYHTKIDKDFGYGGCTVTGMMQAINRYGVLMYSEYNGGNQISDSELVRLGWNRRNNADSVFSKYSPQATNHQIVVCIPNSYEEFIGCLDCGLPVALGTGLRMRKSGDTYQAGGSTAHGMFAWKDKQNGYLWNNDYGDNFGKVSESTLKQQWQRGMHGCFGIIDLERVHNQG